MDKDSPDLCYAQRPRKNDRHLSRLYDGHLAPVGLSVSQFSILTLLSAGSRLRPPTWRIIL